MEPEGSDVLALEAEVLEKHCEALSSRIWARERSHAEILRDMQRDAFAFSKLAQEKRKLMLAGGASAESDTRARTGCSEALVRLAQFTVEDAFSTEPPGPNHTNQFFANLFGLRLLLSAARRTPSLILHWPNSLSSASSWQLPVREYDDQHCKLGSLSRARSERFLFAANSGALFLTTIGGSADDEGRSAAWRSSDRVPLSEHDELQMLRSAQRTKLSWARALLHGSSSLSMCHVVLPQLPPVTVSLDKYVGQIVSAALTYAQRPTGKEGSGTDGVSRSRNAADENDAVCRLLLRGCTRIPLPSSSHGDAECLAENWTLAPPSTRHALFLFRGLSFAIDVLDKYGMPLHGAEVALQVKECMRMSASKSSSSGGGVAAFNSIFKCSLISQDFLLCTGEKRHRWAEIRGCIAAVESNEMSLSLLETAVFVVCLDSTSATFPPACGSRTPSESFSPKEPTYPWGNRWLLNSFNIAVSQLSGQVTLIAPGPLAGCGGDGLTPLAAHMHHEICGNSELFCAEAGHDEWYEANCTAWAASLVFRQLSYIPGKMCHCVFLDQLAEYAAELQKITTDVDDRKALCVATTFIRRCMCENNAGALQAALGVVARNFIVAPHPVIRTPVAALNVSDCDMSAVLTIAVINPLLLVERVKRIDKTATGEGDMVPTRELSGSEREALALEALRELAPGMARRESQEALELFNFALLEIRTSPIAFFSDPCPAADAKFRNRVITSAGKVGFALPQDREEQAAAIMEAPVRKSFNKLMYLLEDDVARLDPWPSIHFWSLLHPQAVPIERMKMNLFKVHSVSRRISRALQSARLPGSGGGPDAALLVRYAHRICIMKALGVLSYFLALLHLSSSSTFEGTVPLASLPIHHDVNSTSSVLSVTRSSVDISRVTSVLYERYMKPRLLGSGNAKDAINEEVVQAAADLLGQLILHHYVPVSADDLVCVGNVPAAENMDIDATENALVQLRRLLLKTPSTFMQSNMSYLDCLDCAARVIPPLPVAISALNDPSSALGYDRIPQLLTIECPLNDFRRSPREVFTVLSHAAGPLPTPSQVLKASTVTYWGCDVPTEQSASNVARLAHPLQLHDCELEACGAFQSKGFQEIFLQASGRCFHELVKLFS
jgi:hypothetical protein